jgi:hypothetical protein
MAQKELLAVVGWLLLDVTLAYGGATGQTHTIAVRDGRLTINVEGSPLSIVLDVIAGESGVSIRGDVPLGARVTANFRDVPIDEGLTRILGTRSAVFVYADDAEVGRGPTLVEVHMYSDPAFGLGAAAPPPTAGPWSSPAAENSDSGNDSERTIVGPRRGFQDQPLVERTTSAQRTLGRALAQEPDPSARARAAGALGSVGGVEAIAQLATSIATDPDTGVREAAAAALGRTWSEHAVGPLVQALREDQRFFVREAAAHALGETWSDAAVDALARALSVDSRQSVRENAAEALGKIGNHGAVDVLIAALGDMHSTVRESAAAALGAIGRHEALNALIQTSLTDGDSWVRQSAASAVEKILSAR